MEKNNPLHAIYEDLQWLQLVIDQVIRSYLLQEGHENHWMDIPVPDLSEDDSPYATCINDWEPNIYERLALALAIAPHIAPEVLDIFFGKNQLYDRGFTEFGGIISDQHSGFIPTGQTLCFLITATNPEWRDEVLNVFDDQSTLTFNKVIELGEVESFIPPLNGALSITNYWIQYFVNGNHPEPEHGEAFPAERITTQLDWEDVVLDSTIMKQLNEITTWLEHGDKLLNEWGLGKKIKPGYRALFYGPPGTGKTLTATLLGKISKRNVYRIDLSMIVSKYIGETEKNLSKIFDMAEQKNWILFFDEADSLFGKRTSTQSSNDRYANQQTGYLLQRVEAFPGIVILASNLKSNMDDAFTRRFQSIIHFTIPTTDERYQLWKRAFSGTCTLDSGIDLYKVAEDYELAGGAIINVLRSCAISVIQRNNTVVSERELLAAIRKEFKKENRTVSILN